eukprot:CAMPEP_0175070938 /NCGR_PEP_ID=MMETSP0052_2-20121109/18975_1 /TAXON_ID=51329 ORGANISM="Polytomella parva, Strain SAG 63-3" /NCGR_SAMPLE_ID=MMETSP0052_2 /ASSEMBLY_ACC=CAM_ASM_000194 /LENGTH=37 /DNA_ID= /DNA_START= /DNA_END= /DNA_ORIENTATION=
MTLTCRAAARTARDGIRHRRGSRVRRTCRIRGGARQH